MLERREHDENDTILHNAHTHTRAHAASVFHRDGGRRLLPWYQVAGLSDTMVRSCPAARPERAEQWSRSADGAAEGTTGQSVSLAELAGLLRPQTLSSHTQWRVGRSRARGNGGEFPACYNKMDSSILVAEAIGHG